MSEERYIVFTVKDFLTYALMIIILFVGFWIFNSWFGLYSSSMALIEAIMSTAFFAWWSITNGIESGNSRIGPI